MDVELVNDITWKSMRMDGLIRKILQSDLRVNRNVVRNHRMGVRRSPSTRTVSYVSGSINPESFRKR